MFRYSPDDTTIPIPLNQLLRSMIQKDADFAVTVEHVEDTALPFKAIPSPGMLAFPKYNSTAPRLRHFSLIADASVDGLGAVMRQKQAGGSNVCF